MVRCSAMAHSVSSGCGGGTWIVIPAYNEERVIATVVRDATSSGHRVVVVDDGSTDATADIAAHTGDVVVRHPINLGQGAALQTGITFALLQGADFIVTFDADGQHRVEDVATLLNALALRRADFALGSRTLGQAPNMPRSRRFLLWAATWFTRLTTGLKVTDAHNGLRAMTGRGASRLKLRQNRMAHASEMLDQIARSKLKYVEVPVSIDYSPYSIGKGQRSTDAIDILLDLWAGRLHQ
jgi:polyprenyl-phospho-N-acetylgalactosaminyl synthase